MALVSKPCPNCGAPTDPILSSCLYCKTILSVSETDSISDEDLISKASEWLGRINQVYALPNPNAKGVFSQMFFPTTKYLSKDEMVSIVEKYLYILNIRANHNPLIKNVVIQIENKLERDKRRITSNTKSIVLGLVGLLSMAVIIVVPIILLAHSCSVAQEKKQNEQISKLNTIEEKIENAVDSGNLGKARVLIEQLSWKDINDDYESVNDTLRKIYDDKREKYLEMLNEIRKQKQKK
jgi:hypothetical protein